MDLLRMSFCSIWWAAARPRPLASIATPNANTIIKAPFGKQHPYLSNVSAICLLDLDCSLLVTTSPSDDFGDPRCALCFKEGRSSVLSSSRHPISLGTLASFPPSPLAAFIGFGLRDLYLPQPLSREISALGSVCNPHMGM